MLIELLAAAGGNAAPQNKFGIQQAIEQGGLIASAIRDSCSAIMSFGSFYILFTKLVGAAEDHERRRRRCARPSGARRTLREGASKLDKNSAYRQIVDDGLRAEDQHAG